MRTGSTSTDGQGAVSTLLPIMGVVFVGFLVIGMALPVLPLHVHDRLGLGTFIVGLVTGSQFAASLVARVWSGRASDTHGPKRAVVTGLAAAAAAGLCYLLSTAFLATPPLSAAVLLVGRAVLGGAESFIITGATTWGLARAGSQNAGKVIAWMGTAMFAAFAAGAPLGTTLYAHGGFAAVALATSLLPLATLILTIPLQGSKPAQKGSPSFLSVVGRLWLPGLASALSSIGFGALITFSALLFSARHWEPVWLAFTAYAVALIAARLLFGHLPDRHGGAKVALVCVVIEVAGLGLIGLAASVTVAAIGAALTGLGYALVFPGFGVEAVRRAPPESRGVAMGAYTACLDLALGISGPVLGLIAGRGGLSTVFLVSAVLVLCAAPIALRLLVPLAGREPPAPWENPHESPTRGTDRPRPVRHAFRARRSGRNGSAGGRARAAALQRRRLGGRPVEAARADAARPQRRDRIGVDRDGPDGDPRGRAEPRARQRGEAGGTGRDHDPSRLLRRLAERALGRPRRQADLRGAGLRRGAARGAG